MSKAVIWYASALLMLAASQAGAQDLPGYGYPTPPPGGGSGSPAVCPRPAPGSVVLPPPDIHSWAGVLSTQLQYNTTVQTDVTPNRTLFCFQADPSGWEGPTLRINPGDLLNVRVTNNVPASGTVVETVSTTEGQCGSLIRTPETMNIHYHGAPVSPACGQDQVIHTMVNSSESFQYSIPWPSYTPPGLYWYHHHVHGNAAAAVKGGASAVLVVGGIQNFFPWLTGIRERILVVRDVPLITAPVSPVAANAPCPGTDGTNGQVRGASGWSLNYVSIDLATDCSYTPAVIQAVPNGYELWRVANSGSDTVLDIQVIDDAGNVKPLTLVAIDGVPTGSENGLQRGTPVTTNDILLAPAARSEFVVPTPPPGKTWKLVANHITFSGRLGGDGIGGFGFQATQTVTLANIRTDHPTALPVIPAPTKFVPPSIPASQKLINKTPTVYRTLFFDEPPAGVPPTPQAQANGITGNSIFIMAVVNQDGTINNSPFDVSNPPAIVSTQGTVEQWTVENHTEENHEFHFHQLRFLVLSQNNYPRDPATGLPYEFGIEAPYEVGQFLDMIQVPSAPVSFFTPAAGLFRPYTPPAGASPPSVTFRLNFMGSDIGDFVFHCHILGHEDAGMMQIIRVVPPTSH